ncbi:nuclear transport factor 2 family protein [Cnuibacter physcomitrellae]|uniref:nuclear transport factor 2 family protein n=1 Tax=Cnuibacter physcomitrellae TaxID=1619308 RepID=UPI002175F933|nr:nuclear transport factor 2 family protein [Cnuibacter physcomitrellae]MCS5498335.1 nuclear transport factor 2 family protein [Cnuibacter physcomitrellae]
MTDVDDEQVRAAWRTMREAMVDGDVEALGRILDPGFVLVHMTGHHQPRQEWLEEIASGAAVYHAVDDESVEVDARDPDAPVVAARTFTDVTLGGERGRWQTGFRTGFRRRHGGWTAVRTEGYAW